MAKPHSRDEQAHLFIESLEGPWFTETHAPQAHLASVFTALKGSGGQILFSDDGILLVRFETVSRAIFYLLALQLRWKDKIPAPVRFSIDTVDNNDARSSISIAKEKLLPFATTGGNAVLSSRALYRLSEDERIDFGLSSQPSNDGVFQLPLQHDRRDESWSSADLDLFEVSKQIIDLTPVQRPAPICVEVRHGKLYLARHESQTAPIDRNNAEAAKETIIVSGEFLNEQLRQSNCDLRLVHSFNLLQKSLISSSNVIDVGLQRLSCAAMYEHFSEELSAALKAIIQSHLGMADMYLAQFPEWLRFADNAAEAMISDYEQGVASKVIAKVIADLEENQELTAPEVPRALKYLQELLETPGKGGQRAAFAVIRSIENIISGIFRYGADFLRKTIDKTVDALSGTVSKVVVIGLLSLAVGSASMISPLGSQLKELSWISNAAKLVNKQIDALKVMSD